VEEEGRFKYKYNWDTLLQYWNRMKMMCAPCQGQP